MIVGIEIKGEKKKISEDEEIVKKSVEIEGGEIEKDEFERIFGGNKEGKKIKIGEKSILGKLLIGRDLIEEEDLIEIKKRGEKRKKFEIDEMMGKIKEKRKEMSGKILKIDKIKMMMMRNKEDGKKREIGKMIVIDGVEMVLINKIEEMRELKSNKKIRIKEKMN